MTDRYLITTADVKTWKFDRPVLFLGEWCRPHYLKHLWSNMDAELAMPYGLNIWQNEIDHAYLSTLSSQLMKELASALNILHGVNYSVRYWHIVVGNWLQVYLRVIYNRYFSLKQTIDNYAVSGTTVFDFTLPGLLVTTDGISLSYKRIDDVWNNMIYAQVLRFWGYKSFDFLTDVDHVQQEKSLNLSPSCSRSLQKILSFFLNCYMKIVPGLFQRQNDAFIINSYLSRIEETKLQLLLGQAPAFYKSNDLSEMRVEFDVNQRRHLDLDFDKYKGFESFVRKLLPEVIPLCYVEGYQQLVEQARQLCWPKKPKFILTGNDYQYNEVFKVWAASKTNSNIPYYITLHGSNQECVGYPNWFELVYSDKFFTWGFTNESKKIIPMFNFKISGCRKGNNESDGCLLLIQHSQTGLWGPEDLVYKYKVYLKAQFSFVKALPAPIRQKLLVRLHSSCKIFIDDDELIWKEHFPKVCLELGKMAISTLRNKSRLVVHSYDSTGLPETLGLNIPTLLFWPGKLEDILPIARPYYQLLRDAGIFAESAEYAAELVNLYWGDIESWWNSKKVQDARKDFCQNYSRVVKQPLRLFKKNLLCDLNK